MNVLKAWLALALLLLAVYGSYTLWRVYEAGPRRGQPTAAVAVPSGASMLPPVELGDYTFTERSGQPFALEELEGRIWVASFFFTSCPGPCRQMNMAVAGLQRDLEGKEVTLVSITVDPANDTPAVLSQYAAGFEADPQRWLFLRGEFELTKRFSEEQFKLPMATNMHSERLILIDGAGKVQGMFHATKPLEVERLKQRIDELLAAMGPTAKERTVDRDSPEEAAASDAVAAPQRGAL